MMGLKMLSGGEPAGWWWASLPIPFLAAGQRMILYRCPREPREAYFVWNAIQYVRNPGCGLVMGYLRLLLEPFMQSVEVAAALGQLGIGAGSGMAVWHQCTRFKALFSLDGHQKKARVITGSGKIWLIVPFQFHLCFSSMILT